MTPPRASRRGVVGLMLILSTVYLASMAMSRVTNDVVSSTLAAWQIAETGSPWLENVDYSEHEGSADLWIETAPNGHEVAYRSPGSIAVGVPAYLVARAFRGDQFSIIPGSITAALLTAVALGLLFSALRPRVGTHVALGSVLALGLTTPIWSVSADSLWTHPVTILGVAGMAWAAVRERWWLVGVFGGVALWGRFHMALMVAVLGLGLSWAHRRPKIALEVGSVSAGFLGLACVWSRWMYGSWSPAGGYSVGAYTERATDTASPMPALINHLGLWVAPDRGILVWTPVLLLLSPAVVRSWRSQPAWSRWLALGGVAYTLVQGQLNAFMGGSGFYGYRLTLELLVCVSPLYVLSLPRAGSWARRLLGPVIGLQFAVMSIGAANDGGLLLLSTAWTDNSFIKAIRIAPALAAWPILMTMIGAIGGYAIRRRAAQSPTAPTTPVGSDVGASDQLDRV